jgi:hypothetical protein
MATISFLWNGIDQPSLPTATTNFHRGSTSGYHRPQGYNESWTGSSLTYDALLRHPYPIGGTIQSWSFKQTNGDFAFSVTGLGIKATPATNYVNFLGTMAAGRDDWHGDAKNNFFPWSVGGDTYHGGAGIDTVIGAGMTKAMLLGTSPTFTKKGEFVYVSSVGNTSIQLDSIERLQFTDVSVALDLNGNAGAAARIIGAVFGPALVKSKELAGVAIDLLDSGWSPLQLTQLALDVMLGEQYTSSDLVKLVYRNITKKSPSGFEAQLYESMLHEGRFTGAELTWAAAGSDLNAANIDLTGLSATGLDYLSWQG